MHEIDPIDIQGAGGGGGGGGKEGGQSRNPVEAANSLFSVAFAKTVFLLSEGEIEGFPNGITKDIYFDGTVFQRNDGTYNFKEVYLDYRPGTDSQDPMSGFSQVENTVNVSAQVIRDVGPVTRTITDGDVERVRVIIQHPSLQSIDSNTGDTNPTSVSYRISVSSNGGPFVTQAEPTISGKSSGQFQRAYEFDLPAGGNPWQVRVERLTADSGSSLLSNSIIWQAYTEIVDEKFAYPNSAVLGIKIDARQFNNIPDVKVRLCGKKVQVPQNYDPVTRTYTGLWDGTFKSAWTDNPAWIFRDLVVNPIYGVKRYLPSADVDKWTLLEISRYCDELVPDGNGGTEPRFRCNVFLQNEGGVFEVLNAIASVFRGLIHYSNGKLLLTQDRPGTPVQQFSEANVLQEVDESGNVTTPTFVYQGTSRTARKSVILASWDDPTQDYNQVAEYLQDDELLRKFGYLPTDLRLLGVTSRGQALRAAKFALFTNRYLTDKVSFRVAAEGLASGIGDVIQIADPLRQGQRLGGRVRAVRGSTLVLDAQLTLQQNVVYTVTLLNPGGTTTTNPDGTTDTKPALTVFDVLQWSNDTDSGLTELTLRTNSNLDNQIGCLWVLEWQDMNASLYRILTVSETAPFEFQIEAIPYNESAYGYIDNNLPVATPKDRFVIRDVNPPTSLSAKLDYRNGRVRIFASWVAPQNDGIDDAQVSEYRYQYRQAGAESWSDYSTTLYTQADVSLPQFYMGTQYQFRVASRNRLGQQSNWLQVDVQDFDAFVNLADPSYNASVRHQNQPDGSQLILVSTGTLPVPERVKGVIIWAKPLNPDGPVPGVHDPGPDGYYLLSDNVPLAGYYTISFHIPSDYSIRVGLTSKVPGEVSTNYIYDVVYRDEIVPPAPSNFTVVESQDSRTKRFSWQVPLSKYGSWDRFVVSDISGYRIRYRQGGLESLTPLQAWEYAIDLYSGGVPATQTWFDTALFDSDTWTVLIRSTDATGWESDDVSYIVLNTNDPLVQNIVGTGSLDIEAAENEFSNCQLTDTLVLVTEPVQVVDYSQSGPYELATEAGVVLTTENDIELSVYGDVQTLTVQYSIATESGDLLGASTGIYQIAQIDPTQDAFFTWRFINDAINSTLRMTTNAAGTYQHFLGALTGSDVPLLQENTNEIWQETDQPVLVEQRDYSNISVSKLAAGVLHPYAPLERLTEDLYGVKTVLKSLDGTTPAVIYGVDYELDYPDIFESINDTLISAVTGSTVSLSKPFRAIKAVQVTIQDNGSGAVSAVVLSKSITSVSIKTLNAAGAAVAGLVDVLVQGY